jgi:hypothetical protein
MGANITLDGAPINGFTAIGATGYGVARIKPSQRHVDGNHDFARRPEVRRPVYGYGQYTSYWYPGGLDLEAIPQ